MRNFRYFSPSLLLVLLSTFSSFIHANTAFDLGDRYFTSVDNNTNNSPQIVNQIFQDAKGFIWLGGESSLIRFDGYQFKYFAPDVPFYQIETMWQAPNGDIWLGTFSHGLFIFDPQTESFKEISPDYLPYVRDVKIHSIVGNAKYNVWLATSLGLVNINLLTKAIHRYQHEPNNPDSLNSTYVKTLVLDEKNDLWVGSKKGINLLKANTSRFISIDKDFESPYATYGKLIYQLHLTDDGKLWASTRANGIAVIDRSTLEKQWITLGDSSPTNNGSTFSYDVQQTSSTEVWVSTYSDGVIVISMNTLEVVDHIRHDPGKPGTITSNQVYALTRDNSGLIWLATWGGGVNIYNPINNAFRTLRMGWWESGVLSRNKVLDVFLDWSENLWVLTEQNFVHYINKKTGDTKVSSLSRGSNSSGITLQDMAQTSINDIWLATLYDGIFHYNVSNNSFTPLNIDIPAPPHNKNNVQIQLLKDNGDGRLWIGSTYGLSLYDPIKQSIEAIKNPDNQSELFSLAIKSLVIDKNGLVWVGTNSGLYFIDMEVFKIKNFIPQIDDFKDIFQGVIWNLAIADNGSIEVSTQQGVFNVEKNNNGYQLNLNHPLKHVNWSSTLTKDKQGRLWSNVGMYNYITNKSTPLDKANGVDIGHSGWSSASSKDKRFMYIAGAKGLLMVDTEQYKEWQFSAPIIISSLVIDDKKIPSYHLQRLTLPVNSTKLAIEFSALDYSYPEKNRYAYKLEGYDSDWIEADSSQRTVNYSFLPPGQYQFSLKGTNRSGIWSNEVIQIDIIKLPAWHQTWYFYVFVVLLAIGSIFLLIQYRTRQLKRNAIALHAQVVSKTQNIVALGMVGNELADCNDMQEICEKVYTHINGIVDISAFAISLVNNTTKHIDTVWAVKNGQVIESSSISLDSTLMSSVQCVNQCREIITQNKEDWQALKLTKSGPFSSSGMSHICIPLKKSNTVLGCLIIESQQENVYQISEIEIIRIIASHVALAISGAISYRSLEKISITDPLTGLYNRRFISNNLPQDISKVHREWNVFGESLDMGFLLIDIDHFKSINDLNGHNVGDEILIQISDLLKHTCREGDWVTRWGGEEFLIVCRFINRNELTQLAERLRSAIATHKFSVDKQQTQLNVTCSFGIAAYPFAKNDLNKLSWEQTVRIADSALYKAKETGRNRWVYFEDNQKIEVSMLYEKIVESVDAVITNGSLSAHYSQHETTL